VRSAGCEPAEQGEEQPRLRPQLFGRFRSRRLEQLGRCATLIRLSNDDLDHVPFRELASLNISPADTDCGRLDRTSAVCTAGRDGRRIVYRAERRAVQGSRCSVSLLQRADDRRSQRRSD
jgi:hypothetical protein